MNIIEQDKAYIELRRSLFRNPKFHRGPLYVRESLLVLINALAKIGKSLANVNILEIGCGCWHPLGLAALYYLNGAKYVVATDLAPNIDPPRSAEALYELLLACLAHPAEYALDSKADVSLFLDRIRNFDLAALRDGDLDKGIRRTELKHVVSDIYKFKDHGKFDVIYSRAVLEHFPDMQAAGTEMLSLMEDDGVGIHLVDYTDHRRYRAPEKYHAWSFLQKDYDPTDFHAAELSNRLRPSEMRSVLENAGLQVDCQNSASLAMSDEIYGKLAARFLEFPRSELSIAIETICLSKKKEGKVESREDLGHHFEILMACIYKTSLQSGDSVIDGGANGGLHTFPLAHVVGPSGHVYAFEPQIAESAGLKQRLSNDEFANRVVTVIPEALGKTIGTASLYIRGANGALSSLNKPVGPIKDGEVIIQETKVSTLDSKNFRGPISFIKLDLEGGEFASLQGASTMLSKDLPIIAFENGKAWPAQQNGYSKEQFFDFFEELGYLLFDFYGQKFSIDRWDDKSTGWYFLALPHKHKRLDEILGVIAWYWKRIKGTPVITSWASVVNRVSKVAKSGPRSVAMDEWEAPAWHDLTMPAIHGSDFKKASIQLLARPNQEHVESFIDNVGEGWLASGEGRLRLRFQLVSLFRNGQVQGLWISGYGGVGRLLLPSKRVVSPYFGQRHADISWSAESRFLVDTDTVLSDVLSSADSLELLTQVSGNYVKVGTIRFST